MTATFHKTNVIIGASLVDREDGEGKYWRMPRPFDVVRHFKSAGTRRLFNQGRMSYVAATREVPVYKGMDNRTYRMAINDLKRGATEVQDHFLVRFARNFLGMNTA